MQRYGSAALTIEAVCAILNIFYTGCIHLLWNSVVAVDRGGRVKKLRINGNGIPLAKCRLDDESARFLDIKK
jgi:hypothetical protein